MPGDTYGATLLCYQRDARHSNVLHLHAYSIERINCRCDKTKRSLEFRSIIYVQRLFAAGPLFFSPRERFGMRNRNLGRDLCLLLLIVLFGLCVRLDGTRLWDRDETRNARCALEMLERNDWVVPTFNEELRAQKPVLLYWLIRCSYAVFGVNEFAARFPSVLLGIGTVLATFVIGRRLFSPEVGLLAGIILSTSIMFQVASRAATPDAALIFCSTFGLMIFVLTTFKSRTESGTRTAPSPRSAGQYFSPTWLSAAAVYLLFSFGILAKGPVGLILPTAVIGMFLLIIKLPTVEQLKIPGSWFSRFKERALVMLRCFGPTHFFKTCLQMRLLTATLIALAVAGPWYVLVGQRTDGAFLQSFFLRENFGRAMNAMEGHSGGPFFYIIAVLVGFFPWSIFAAPMIVGAYCRVRRDDPWRIGYVFILCWLGVYIVLFSFAATKLPSYITPCYPALALLCSCFLVHFANQRAVAPTAWINFCLAFVFIVGAVFLIGLPIVAGLFMPGEAWMGVLGVILLVGGYVCYRCLRKSLFRRFVWSFAGMAILLFLTVFGVILPGVDGHRHELRIAQRIHESEASASVGAYGSVDPSLIFYGNRPIPSYYNLKAVATFLKQPDAILLTTDRNYGDIAGIIPPHMTVLAEAPRFFRQEKWILVGRPTAMSKRLLEESSRH